MPDTVHGPAGLIKTDQPGRPLFGCRCGEFASGVDGVAWRIIEHPDSTVSLMPSVNWPGHFHEYLVGVPWISYDQLQAMAAAEKPVWLGQAGQGIP